MISPKSALAQVTMSFLIRSNIGLFLKKENSKKSLNASSSGGFRQKMENVVKIFMTIISNSIVFKLFTLNQAIDAVNY